ncbi:protein containing Glycosyl transferase group 1 domain protein [Bacteroides sp. CAG:754]|jgi:glycosyltransferase involved in cell wall biosynthesis|uniref:glycosyltransferase family 4 protein n=1 Tax=uncultured Bacteroides sp. TaxID=162156 RepID=UPI00033ABFAF|nr:glycosyltransferase [uncultured Bacteroides sp.]CDA86845.1 protein containing Glycosyl transferase group 1 domain protein [Bacteroides sp. CAG:754]
MTIVFVSIALNIHQACVADELYKLTNGNYWFVETGDVDNDYSKGGDMNDFSSRPYLIRLADGKESVQKALRLIREVDVMIYAAAPLIFLKERIRTNKITFINSERWLKRGVINLLSPRLLKQQWYYHTSCHGKPFYALCSSAYAAGDFRLMQSFKKKCYKWGYFTAVPDIDIEVIQKAKRNASTVKILWVARFLQLKHPERMLQLASLLYREKVDFIINMIGTGPEYSKIEALIQRKGLKGVVHLLGSMHNSKVIETMRMHDIFCFTSDKNEGWGAVLNEAMSCGCCPVSSIETGSTPYLIKEGINGFSFNLKKKNDLFDKVLWLIKHPKERERMSIEAYKTIRDVWSPKNAAEQLYKLCQSMLQGENYVVEDGPCSKAE